MNKNFILALASAFILTGCFSTPGPDASYKNRPPVSSLVKLGDDIDNAISVLRNNGYKVSDKYYPTVNKKYWFATVYLGGPIPFRATLYETWGTGPFLGKGPAIYVVLESGLDKKIREIH